MDCNKVNGILSDTIARGYSMIQHVHFEENSFRKHFREIKQNQFIFLDNIQSMQYNSQEANK